MPPPKTKKSDLCLLASLSWVGFLSMGLNLFLVLFLLVCQKCTPKKNTKRSDLCLLSTLSWVPLHGSELFVFLVLAGLPISAPKKNQTYVSCPASPGSLSLGLNFLFFLAGPLSLSLHGAAKEGTLEEGRVGTHSARPQLRLGKAQLTKIDLSFWPSPSRIQVG